MRIPSSRALGRASTTLAIVLASCGRSPPAPVTSTPSPQGPSPSDLPAEAADLMYLASTEDSTVYLEVPPEILADVRAQLVRWGREDVARQLARLYDLRTGFVRDTAHARQAETRLRSGQLREGRR